MDKPETPNTPKSQETFFEFPCQFPIKIMANPGKEVTQFVLDALEKHIIDSENIEFKTRESKTGKYISITAIFTATNKAQLDALYTEISSHPEVHMVL
jgi:uncharacterized protein